MTAENVHYVYSSAAVSVAINLRFKREAFQSEITMDYYNYVIEAQRQTQ